jgi:hypothetical protein
VHRIAAGVQRLPGHEVAVTLGDVDRILDLLEQAVDRREDWAAGLRSPDAFSGLRQHPRFVKLLGRMGE